MLRERIIKLFLKLFQRKGHLPQASIACIADQLHLIPVNVHLRVYDLNTSFLRHNDFLLRFTLIFDLILCLPDIFRSLSYAPPPFLLRRKRKEPPMLFASVALTVGSV